MTGYIDFAVQKNCWNLIDSYGMLCVGCGCCLKDKRKRYKNRIIVLERWLAEQENFDGWIEGSEELQKENIKSNIRCFKRQLHYYRKRLEQLTQTDGDGNV